MTTRIFGLLAAIAAVAVSGCGGGDVEVKVTPSFPPVDPARNTDFVASEPFSIDLSGAGRTRLVLAGVNGNMVVTGGPAAGAVTISGDRRVGSDSLADAQAQLPNLQLDVQEVGNDIRVRTVQPQSSGGRSYVVDYRVRVPATMALDVALVNGTIELSGMNSDVRASLVNGRTAATLQVPVAGAVDLEGVNGDIELHVPLGTSALLSAQVAIGNIVLQDHALHDEVRSGRSLLGTLGSGSGSVRLKTTNGSIWIDGKI